MWKKKEIYYNRGITFIMIINYYYNLLDLLLVLSENIVDQQVHYKLH